MSEENDNTLDLGSIVFTPDWARGSAGVTIGKHGRGAGAEADGDRGTQRPDGGRKQFGNRKPFGDRKQFGDRKPFADRKQFGDRKPLGDRKPFGERRQFEPRERPLSVDVKVLPETKALGAIIRRLQQDIHAYKLKDLAYFFLDNPAAVTLRISPRAAEGGAPALAFRQCRACGFAALSEGDLIDHVLGAHLGDYYDAREVECEPPSGNFACVAKCGLSGELLGPPNVHDFNSVVREMIRTKFPGMSEEQYRSRIEMVRDSESIEAWRKSRTKKTLYFPKGAAEDAAGLSREQAEAELKRTILASLMDSPKVLTLTAETALKSPVGSLRAAARDALEAERRMPAGMCFALRGAFHHRRLKFFRANDARGPEFVTNVEYREFDSAHAIPELAAAAKFLAEHPCCDKSEFPAEGDFEKHMNWLVTTGHAVAFTNGVYSQVEKFPKYGPQWKRRKPAKTQESVVEPVAEQQPAAEPVAEQPVAEPITEQPAVEPVAEQQPAAEPVVEQQPAAEPVAEQPVAEPSLQPVDEPAAVEAKKEENENEAAPVVAE